MNLKSEPGPMLDLGTGTTDKPKPLTCTRCYRTYSGLACACIQEVADKESASLLLRRTDVPLVLWKEHIRLRPGKAACGRRGLPATMNSRFIKTIPKQTMDKAVICKNCLKALGVQI